MPVDVTFFALAEDKNRTILEGHGSHVAAGAYSPNGKLLATAGGDKSILLWDVENAQEDKLPRRLYRPDPPHPLYGRR